jgi:arginine-tRNA-protein transferase
VDRPRLDAEKAKLYSRYLQYQHADTPEESPADVESFLYTTAVQTLEFEYWLCDRLVAVSLADACSRSLSSVYAYFEPDEAKRSLGVFSSLWELAYCQSARIPFYYLGFYVAGCRKMDYKARFRPCEWQETQGRWEPMAPTSA